MSIEFEFTSVGRYFVVYRDALRVSQHTTEREAIERAIDEATLFPDAAVRYTHEYEVKVSKLKRRIPTFVEGAYAGAGSASTTLVQGDSYRPTWPGSPVITFANVSAYAVTVNWIAAYDAVGVAYYRLERARSADFVTGYTLLANATTALTYNDSGLTPSTPYWYRVSAVDGAGNRSVYSSETTTTQGAPGGSIYDGYIPTTIVSTAAQFAAALSNAAAGTVIGVDPGVYTGTNTGLRFTPAWRLPSFRHGTASQRIVIVAKYPASTNVGGAVSELRSGATANGTGCPAFGCENNDYVDWIGFYVNETNSATTTDTGAVVFVGSNNSTVKRAHLVGKPGYIPGDNHPAIRAEDATFITVADCRIETWQGGINQPALETYRTGNITFENNYVSGCGAGVHHKSNSRINNNNGYTPPENRGPFYYRKNLIVGCGVGISFGRCYPDYPIYVTQNIISGSTGNAAINTLTYQTGDGLQNTHIVNNTIYGGAERGIRLQYQCESGNRCYNNIITNAPRCFTTYTNVNVGKTYWDAEHNCYQATAGTGIIVIDDEGPSTIYTLTSWKATGQDSVSPAAISANPLFVNAGVDFHLQAGSPCAALGVDILGLSGSVGATIPAGAYITGTEVIGIRP